MIILIMMAPVRESSALRVAHAAVADGLEQAAVAEGALIAAHRVRRLAAAPERDAVRRRRRSLYSVAEFLKRIKLKHVLFIRAIFIVTIFYYLN